MITPKRLITTWVDFGTYRESDRRMFYRCLQSWHRLMPDWDIRIVSTGNILDYGGDYWILEQLKTKHGIGASQWARLWWLYTLGGVYVDMDQEAVKRFDPLLDGTFFCGHFGPLDPFVGNGIIGAPAGHPFLKEQLEYLCDLDVKDPQFGNESGPRMVTRLLSQYGWDGKNEHTYLEQANITVYPDTVFYPYHWTERYTPRCIRPETVAVHHWASSWDQHNPMTPEHARA